VVLVALPTTPAPLLLASRRTGKPRSTAHGVKARHARLRSVGYYENLEAADNWEAGPSSSAALSPSADSHKLRGRMQLLAQVRTRARVLGAKGKELVKLCSQGNQQACARIATDPHELRALQYQEARQRRAQQLHLQGHGGVENRQLAGVAAEANAEATNALAYQDEADAGNIWDASHWQSAALGDVVSNQWLAACGQGNAAACRHIAGSNGALQALLTSSSKPGPPIEAYMPATVPRPVYVAPKKRKAAPGMLSDVMNMLGLDDQYDGSGVKSAAVPKMVPDVGFHEGPKYTAVWNDGTIAPELSDNDNKKFYRDARKLLKTSLSFTDTVKAKPPILWKQ
jgi:hypothetical protein